MFRELSEFQTPQDDTIIWRYMDLWKFIDLIQTNELYFPRIDQLGDLTEGLFPEEAQNRLFQFLENSEMQEEADGLRNGLTNPRHRLDKFISSWNMSDNESFLLWKAYTSDLSAVAIKSTIRNLQLALEAETDINNYIGRVTYHAINDYRFNGNMFSLTNQKFDYYSGENELRIVSTLSSAGTPIEAHPKFLKIKINTEALINEVYLSPKAGSTQFSIIEKILSDNMLIKPVRISGIKDQWLHL